MGHADERVADAVNQQMRITARPIPRPADDLERSGTTLSAFLADSILSSYGIYLDPVGSLAPVVEH